MLVKSLYPHVRIFADLLCVKSRAGLDSLLSVFVLLEGLVSSVKFHMVAAQILSLLLFILYALIRDGVKLIKAKRNVIARHKQDRNVLVVVALPVAIDAVVVLLTGPIDAIHGASV